jgi:hypothetical protein
MAMRKKTFMATTIISSFFFSLIARTPSEIVWTNFVDKYLPQEV